MFEAKNIKTGLNTEALESLLNIRRSKTKREKYDEEIERGGGKSGERKSEQVMCSRLNRSKLMFWLRPL